MKAKSSTPNDGAIYGADLVYRARQRTSRELRLISSNLSPSYVAAISGNTPYATLPNGMTIVMRQCNNWGC